jgi:hypothetical protein
MSVIVKAENIQQFLAVCMWIYYKVT